MSHRKDHCRQIIDGMLCGNSKKRTSAQCKTCWMKKMQKTKQQPGYSYTLMGDEIWKSRGKWEAVING